MCQTHCQILLIRGGEKMSHLTELHSNERETIIKTIIQP